MLKLQLIMEVLPNRRLEYYSIANPQFHSFENNNQIFAITGPLPCDELNLLQQTLPTSLRSKWPGWGKPTVKATLKHIRQRVIKQLDHHFIPVQLNAFWSKLAKPATGLLTDMHGVLRGRLLLEEELQGMLRTAQWWPGDVEQGINYGVINNVLQWWPGIINHRWGVKQCVRCHGTEVVARPCVHCGRADCYTCLSCESLGTITSCRRLLALKESQLQSTPGCQVDINWQFSLTKAQQLAADRLHRFLAGDKQHCLLWAACGAGKTEVTFGGIQQVLCRGGQVLYAIPRRDVVVELAERLATSFPGVDLAVHYGGKPWFSQGDLVVATTHQVLRFYQRFDLVILDEVDAFPYHGNEMLRFGVRRALKPGGKLVEMTATPKTQGEATKVIAIPARYHGYPLPEPTLVKLKLVSTDILGKQHLPNQVLKMLEGEEPWLVFMPTIKGCQQVGAYLQRLSSRRVEFSYAGDVQRDEKKQGLSSGQLDILVATAIFERGITIPHIQVMVLYADHRFYDQSTLIQMAGRVGRKHQAPTGKVVFVANKISPAMQGAKNKIAELNSKAAAQGLLKVGYPCG